ncbi:MAG: flagellar biosynthesis anti-sigma factor FlgM [Desulfobacterales bacterium]
MKIYSGQEIQQLVTIQKKPLSDAAPNSSRAHENDKVDFSTQLRRVQGMENHFSPDSDRQARLQEVKEQIENGTYAPDSKKVAVSLLKYIVKGSNNG